MTSEITILKKLWKERNRDKYNLSLKWFLDTFHLNTNNIKYIFTDLSSRQLHFILSKILFPYVGRIFSIVTKYITFSSSLNTFKKHKSCQNIHKLTMHTSSLQKYPNSLYCDTCPPNNPCSFFFCASKYLNN